MAFRDGEHDVRAQVGAVLVAEGITNLRLIWNKLKSL